MKDNVKKIISLIAAASICSTFAFAAPKEVIRGDADINGELSIVDVVMLRSHIVGDTLLSAENKKAADVNADGQIDVTDVTMLRSHIVGNSQITDKVTVDDENIMSLQTFPVTEEYVKTQGRTYYYDDSMWLIQSASAVEFEFTGTYGSVTVHGDQNCFDSWAEKSLVRLGIFVNGEMVVDELVDNYVKEYTFLNTDEPIDATVKIVKLSDPAESVVGINSIKAASKDGIRPLPEKDLKIEFIGDSITCGVGVDDAVTGIYQTASVNSTKTYAYKVAQAFDADYSFFAYSGYGVISGYTSSGKKNTRQTIPPIYETYGTSMGKLAETLDPSGLSWDFSAWQPDLVVINLGTNDYSYAKTEETKAEFIEGYAEFLKQVRKNNPDAPILCTLGLGGTGLYLRIVKAVEQYTAETGDTSVYCLKLSTIQEGDGTGVQGHPLEVSHERAAGEIISELENILGWEAKY